MRNLSLVIFVGLLLLLPPHQAVAADSACAKVTMEILQELTLERVAFDARLVLTNNLLDRDIEKIRVDVEIADQSGKRADQLFYVGIPTTSNFSAVDGTGVVKPQTRGEAHWLIIPAPGAGGTDPAGIYYFVGATLSYSVAGVEKMVPIFPDRITVKPMPELYLDYFIPYKVLADNPFTAEVEPSIPFPLALRVINDGFGPANKLKSDSAQPQIVTNAQGLLADFKLLGAAVNDNPISPTLTVDFGNVPSKSCATAYWEMTSSLSGRFEKFDVSFTHASELGGELTSLIKETNAHYLVHRIKVNRPGRDGLLDFLADADKDSEHLPDVIFESEIPAGGVDRSDARSPVTVISPASLPSRPTPENPKVDLILNLSDTPMGWIYTKLPDPSQGLLKLLDVVRADGVHLDPHNFWIDEGLDTNYQKTFTLQFIDYRADGIAPDKYVMFFTQPDDDVEAPVSTLVFDGPVVEGEHIYLTPNTRIVFTARDNDGGSGVDQMFKRVLGQDEAFTEAVPFNLTASGSYTLDYYSVDRAGNVASVKSASLVVDDAAPEIAVFRVSPSTFAPQAPSGVAATRSVEFSLTVGDTVPSLAVTVEITDAVGKVVRTLTGTASAGVPFTLAWDGKGADGHLVAEGTYTARLTVSDGLGHVATSEVTVTAAKWFNDNPVDSAPGAQQIHGALSGTVTVWQDDRNGQWDIYLKDLAALGVTSTRLTTDTGSQEHPAIDGNIVVWQDDRSGTWDIYGYDRVAQQEIVISQESGDQTDPVVAGNWIAWQDNRNGNWDIRVKNFVTGEERQITSHERDQIRPAISGTLLGWEDYRHGLGEIYTIDLAGGSESRITVDIANQFLPAVSDDNVVWVDQRDGEQEIYRQVGTVAQRLTYGGGAHTQPALAGGLLVFTDFEAGSDDPNLSFLDVSAQSGGRLSSHPARQEEPAVGAGVVIWQDDRDGTWQIYTAKLAVSELPVEVTLRPGFNLVAAGQLLVDTYGSAAGLVGAAAAPFIQRALHFSAPHDQFFEADVANGGDFALTAGMGIILYSNAEVILPVATAGESASFTLLPGANHVGMLTVPYGYRAFDLLHSLGLEKVVGVRRFDSETGLWQSAAVRENAGGPEVVGSNFVIKAGDGLMVTMKEQIDGWKP